MQSVVTHVVTASDESTRGRRKAWEHHYDGATGERFKSGWSDMRIEEVEVRRKKNVCNTPAFAISPDLLPDHLQVYGGVSRACEVAGAGNGTVDLSSAGFLKP